LHSILPNYIPDLVKSIRNWEISKIKLTVNHLEENEMFINEKKDKKFYVMRPRKVLKIYRRNISSSFIENN